MKSEAETGSRATDLAAEVARGLCRDRSTWLAIALKWGRDTAWYKQATIEIAAIDRKVGLLLGGGNADYGKWPLGTWTGVKDGEGS